MTYSRYYSVFIIALSCIFIVPTQAVQFTCDPSNYETHIEDCSGGGSSPCALLSDGFIYYAISYYAFGACTIVIYGPPGEYLSIKTQQQFPKSNNTNLAFFDGADSSARELGRVYYGDASSINVLTTDDALTMVLNYDGSDPGCELPCDFVYFLYLTFVNPGAVPYKPCAPLADISLPIGPSGVYDYPINEPELAYRSLTSYTPANCSWRLTAPPGATIQGTLQYFGTMMSGDRLLVYDGGTNSSHVMTTVAGQTEGDIYSTPTFASTGNVVLLEMVVRPGSKLGAVGFLSHFEATRCTGVNVVNVSTLSTNLFSVGSPYGLIPRSGCSFLFTSPPNTQFQLQFQQNLDYSVDPVQMLFYDGNTTSSGLFPTSLDYVFNLVSSTNQILLYIPPLSNLSSPVASTGVYMNAGIVFPATPPFHDSSSGGTNCSTILYGAQTWQLDFETYIYPLGQVFNRTFHIHAGAGQRVFADTTTIGCLQQHGEIWVIDSINNVRMRMYNSDLLGFSYVSQGRNLTIELVVAPGTFAYDFGICYGLAPDPTLTTCPTSITFSADRSYRILQFPPPVTGSGIYAVYPAIARNTTCMWTLNTTNASTVFEVGYSLNLGMLVGDTISFFDGPATNATLLYTMTGGSHVCNSILGDFLLRTSGSFITIQYQSSAISSWLPSARNNTDVLSTRFVYLTLTPKSLPSYLCSVLRTTTLLPESPLTGSPINARNRTCAFSTETSLLGTRSSLILYCNANDIRALAVTTLSVQISNLTGASPFFDETVLDFYCTSGSNGAVISSAGIVLPAGHLLVNATFGPMPTTKPFPLYTLKNQTFNSTFVNCPASPQSTVFFAPTSGVFNQYGLRSPTDPRVAYSTGQVCQQRYAMNTNGGFEFGFDYLDIGPGGWLAIHAGADETFPVVMNLTGRMPLNATMHLLFGSVFFNFHAPTDASARLGLGYRVRFNTYLQWCVSGTIIVTRTFMSPIAIPQSNNERIPPGFVCDFILPSANQWYQLAMTITDPDMTFDILTQFDFVYLGNQSSLGLTPVIRGPARVRVKAGANPSINAMQLAYATFAERPTSLIPTTFCQGTTYLSLPNSEEIGVQTITVLGGNIGFGVYPYPPSLDCRWHFFVPAGVALQFQVSATIWANQDFIEVYIGGHLQRRRTGTFAMPMQSIAGDVDVHFTSSALIPSDTARTFGITITYQFLPLYGASPSMALGDVARRYYGIPTTAGVRFYSSPNTEMPVEDMETLVVLAGSIITLPSSVPNMTYPNLMSITGVLYIVGALASEFEQPVVLQALAFPRLVWVNAIQIAGDFVDARSFAPVKPDDIDGEEGLDFSQAMVPQALTVTAPPIAFQLPQLVVLAKLVARQMANIETINMPRVRFIGDLIISDSDALGGVNISNAHDITIRSIDLESLPGFCSLTFGRNVSLTILILMDMPALDLYATVAQLKVITRTFELQFSPSTIIHIEVGPNFPLAPGCTVSLSNNNYLKTFRLVLGNATSFNFGLQLNANFILQDLLLPDFDYGFLSVSDARIATLDLSSANGIIGLTLTNNHYLAELLAPNVVTMSSGVSITKSALTKVSFPKLYSVVNWGLGQNNDLRVIDACHVTYGAVTASGPFPKMSCDDYFDFLALTCAGESALMSPACDDTIKGTYGCIANTTIAVENGITCAFKLACIQLAITQTIGGQNNSVLVPPGTYTDCSVPLDTLGRGLTLMGSSSGPVVIDCEGSGFAMTIGTGEGADTIIRNIEFRNGQVDTGGAVLISGGASPTFDHVTFSANTASAAGGAVAVMGAGSAPTFLDCVFDANLVLGNGAGGGALFVDEGSTASIQGGRFLQNSAPFGDGGAILFLGAAIFNATVISDAVFVENEAVRGGGIFSEGSLMLHHVTLTGNTASKLGGGLAAVPTSDLGIWFDVHASNVTHNVAGTGGGIFIYSANLAVSDALIEANTASGTIGGGGLATVCSQNYRILFDVADPCPLVVSMTRSTLLGNVALNGGGGGVMIMEMVLSIDDVLFNKNTAGSGGGMSLTTSSVYATLLTFMANSASLGAGVYCEPQRGVCAVTNSSFVGNRASTAGAGAYLCVAACPYAGANADALDRFGPVPDPRAHGNTFALNVAITGRSSGYGSDVATDASSLVFSTPLPSTVVAGRFIGGYAADGEMPLSAVVIQINDYFGQLVSSTTDNSVLTVSLSVEAVDASLDDVSTVSFGRTQTALAVSGGASFTDSTIIVSSLAGLNQRYTLTASLAEISGVTVATNLTVVGCDVGQGRATATDPVTCSDCGAGSYASDATEYVCTPCAAGSFATGPVSSCTPCASGTFAPLPGAATCQMCPDGYGSEVGAASCDAKLVAAGLSSGAVGGVVSGVIIAVVVAILILAFFLYRAARRRTMQKYYLDNDATIRTGTQESPLQKEVKRLLLAANTTRIGGGLYSNVYKAKYENAWIALKVIKGEMATNGTPQQEFRREAIALSRLEERNHPGIVKLCFFLSYNPMCIGVGFCNGGSLKQALANGIFPLFRDKVRLAAEAASAFCAVHAANIVHLDIKTDNILLSDENHVIIADFGIARVISESTEPALPSEYVGGSVKKLGSVESVTSDGSVKIITETEAFDTAFTPQYVDPIRIIQDMNHDGPYLKRADMFSFAITMWAIASGGEPYAGEDPNALVERLREFPQTRPPAIPGIVPAYATWMERCWHEVPAQRPTFPELLEGLKAILAEYAVTLDPGYQ